MNHVLSIILLLSKSIIPRTQEPPTNQHPHLRIYQSLHIVLLNSLNKLKRIDIIHRLLIPWITAGFA
ncbi:hypothetical protein [Bartonella elizabethae]|uniref:hypothetical protein n=1 Tax=Bartonella elizabethae TaxID=807 RepID=UPI000587A8BC|nr:hypothetical protein [Bartonella elizabethae]